MIKIVLITARITFSKAVSHPGNVYFINILLNIPETLFLSLFPRASVVKNSLTPKSAGTRLRLFQPGARGQLRFSLERREDPPLLKFDGPFGSGRRRRQRRRRRRHTPGDCSGFLYARLMHFWRLEYHKDAPVINCATGWRKLNPLPPLR